MPIWAGGAQVDDEARALQGVAILSGSAGDQGGRLLRPRDQEEVRGTAPPQGITQRAWQG